MSPILAQDEVEVKQNCSVEHCHEPRFRDGELCYHHFIEEEAVKWADLDAERQAQLEGVGYIFGDPEPALDGGWWGDCVEEVCG